MDHGLEVGHADGLGALGLAGVHGDDAAADGLGHISAGVDGHDDERSHPNAGTALKRDRSAGEVGQAVVDEYGLQDHGGAAEDLHVDADDHPDQLQDEPLAHGVALCVGNGVQDAADEADDTAHQRGDDRDDQRVADAGHVVGPILGPEPGHIVAQLHKFVHGSAVSFLWKLQYPTLQKQGRILGSFGVNVESGNQIRWWAERQWPGS